ncbi:MAG: helix-turn-helix domain-containing protein [Verrucomicrobia bacterium]|nr:helix-turn-helix domain-containing protein [Verrucomicrobiota bacterium]
MSKQLRQFNPDWYVPPGSTISDLLEEFGWTQAELANRTGFSRKHVNQLIKGIAPINQETALKLERVLGSTVEFWLKREAQYREALTRIEEKKVLAKDLKWLKELPIAEMINLNWINSCKDKTQQIAECLRFFGVGSVSLWREKWECDLAAYRSKTIDKKPKGPIAAWIRQCERLASLCDVPSYDEEKFRKILKEARKLTEQENSEIFIPELKKLCKLSGVTLITLKGLKNCPISGATRWLNSDKPLLMLSDRYKSNDQFWFTFFHEAAHLLFHAKKILFIDTDGQLDSQDEKKANEYASNFLIPLQNWKQILGLSINEKLIKELAKQLGISPAILLGRLQRERLIPWETYLNKFKTKVNFSD